MTKSQVKNKTLDGMPPSEIQGMCGASKPATRIDNTNWCIFTFRKKRMRVVKDEVKDEWWRRGGRGRKMERKGEKIGGDEEGKGTREKRRGIKVDSWSSDFDSSCLRCCGINCHTGRGARASGKRSDGMIQMKIKKDEKGKLTCHFSIETSCS
ncbi:hypothetical protein GOBAR_DD30841 [Gossypium barbadense]|nr:hypothetical protein GOBAR_DD30841 [Gossypium barbadense]